MAAAAFAGLGLVPGVASAFPAESEWLSLKLAGAPLAETAGDCARPELDLAGSATDPAVLWWADEAGLDFRLQVLGDPLVGGALGPGFWGLMLDLDADGRADGLLGLSAEGGLRLWGLPNVAVSTPRVSAAGQALGDVASGAVRVGPGAGPYYWIDLHVDLDAALGAGLGVAQGFRVSAVTSRALGAPLADLAACDGGTEDCGLLLGHQPDTIAYDGDLDGLTGPQEALVRGDPADADSDDDGLLDGEEGLGDSDGDGKPDLRDCDSDNDGLFDGLEAGVTGVGPETNVAANCLIADADGAQTTTDPTLADTDGGGLDDGAEDVNRDGVVGAWETDPNDPDDDVDTDGDGVADVLELQGLDGEIDDADSDGDGIDDAVEGLADPDRDGVPAFSDLDSDGDGVPDAVEGASDPDNDKVPAFLDLDSDGDGIRDADEFDFDGDGVADDTDGDGQIDLLDTDSDGDGVPDAVEADFNQDGVRDDFDGDGLPDMLDEDSDDDGVPDSEEGESDSDGDGVPDRWEMDSDNDGLTDAYEGWVDTDGDGRPDFKDTNSDGDGKSDKTEGIGDIDCDGVLNYVDADDEDTFCTDPLPDPGVDQGPWQQLDSVEPKARGCDSTGGRGFGLWWVVGCLIVGRRRGR